MAATTMILDKDRVARIARMTARFPGPDVQYLLACAAVGGRRSLISPITTGLGVGNVPCQALLETKRGFVSFGLKKPSAAKIVLEQKRVSGRFFTHVHVILHTSYCTYVMYIRTVRRACACHIGKTVRIFF
jgi:hypothetical protein